MTLSVEELESARVNCDMRRIQLMTLQDVAHQGHLAYIQWQAVYLNEMAEFFERELRAAKRRRSDA